jgi:serine/threonine-protein kinase
VVGAAALAVVVLALGAAFKTRRDAGRRERLARQFTEAMARIDSMARYSALSPPHDIRPDLRAVRDQMAQLQRDMQQAGALANGPGHYALGRGYWTLDDPEQAREHLQMAWDAGYREPRVAYALALVLGQQYRDKLLEAQRIAAKDQREARLREVERTLRNPALAFLKQARGADVPSPAYLEALMAFFEGRLDEALAKLKTLGTAEPWFFEAPLLRGSLLQARAWNKWNQGDRDGAHQDFAEGREALQAAAATGRSAPSPYAALGDLELNTFLMEKYGQGDVMAPFTRGAKALETALSLQPDHAPSLILQAALTGELAEVKASKGEDGEALAHQAVEAASLAVKGSPNRADARIALGKAYLMLGNARLRRDQDPTEAFKHGLESFGSLSIGKRDYSAWNHLGFLNLAFAQFESSHGLDSSARLSAAIECFSTATRMEPHWLPAWINLGTCLEQRAGRPKAVNPSKDLEDAVQALEHARTLNPKHFVPYFMLGRVHYALALRARAKGEDATPALQRSRGLYHQGLSINPLSPHLHNGEGVALSELASESWARGQDPGSWISEAKAAYHAAIEAAPAQANGYINLSDMLINESRWLASTHALDEAESVIQRGLKAAPGDKGLLANAARCKAVRVEGALRSGVNPSIHMQAGEAYLAKALAIDPKDRDCWQCLGELRAANAGWKAAWSHATQADFTSARKAFDHALAEEPTSQQSMLALGQLLVAQSGWEQAQKQDARMALTEGLTKAEELLRARPQWAEALALRATLKVLEAEGSSQAFQSKKAQEASRDFAEALRWNRHLARNLAPWVERAKRMGPG